MYFIATKIKDDSYYLDGSIEGWRTEDWHKLVDGFEPIDCVNGELVIYDELGHKYLVGPQTEFEEKKLFWKLKTVDVGQWDFSKGEPFLIDTNEVAPEELRLLLLDYAKRAKEAPNTESLTLEELLARLERSPNRR